MEFLESFLKKNNRPFLISKEGIYYHVSHMGTGKKPTAGEYVKVHYTGCFLDGKVFDSSKNRNQPFVFKLGQGQVIKGWDQGLQLFNEGAKGMLYLTPDFAYGAQGAGGVIPPNDHASLLEAGVAAD